MRLFSSFCGHGNFRKFSGKNISMVAASFVFEGMAKFWKKNIHKSTKSAIFFNFPQRVKENIKKSSKSLTSKIFGKVSGLARIFTFPHGVNTVNTYYFYEKFLKK